jgi:hypothetical protein
MKICSHKTVIAFMENPMLLEAGLRKGEKVKKRGSLQVLTWNADLMKSYRQKRLRV